MDDKKPTGTETSAFGTPGHVSHDSSRFYQSRMYAQLDQGKKVRYFENPVPDGVLDHILCQSSEAMTDLPDASVHLMVTSPPYNAQKDYDEDLSLEDYLDLLYRVWQETYRVLVPGGRACINVANLGRKPYIPLHSYIIDQMVEIGFLMRGEIIWDKAASASPSTAWGSWLSASNPVLRDVHEYILVFSKESFSRPKGERVSTIDKEDFLAWTKSVWQFKAVQARTIGHPAPFPIELPHRCIQLYTFKDDVVLDPFAGSGTTCVAAKQDGRHFVGYDLVPEYCRLAEKRLAETA
ncbi:MAG: site-specific DNA-methyltransferase [Anaerolineaceae bacterium]|nr:site-specific DNA-methyltransferase [Anaerolineaceae bacterium]